MALPRYCMVLSSLLSFGIGAVLYLCAMRPIIYAVLLFFVHGLWGQKDTTVSKLNMLTLNLGYGIDWPGGDLTDRFGQSLSFHTGLDLIRKSSLTLGVDFSYHFGDKIREDVLAPYRNENGLVLGISGVAADLFIRERAAYIGLNAARIVYHTQENSGIELGLGAGLLYHKLHFVDDSRSVLLIEAPYGKGLDRLTRGFALKQEIAYQYHSAKSALHFQLGLYMTEAFTRQVREFNFDTGLPASTDRRLDLLYGFKLVWMLPLVKRSTVPSIRYF